MDVKRFIKKYKTFVLILILGIFFVIIFSELVPYNMDEFVFYHPIICHHYKYNSLNTFRENCHGYDLNLLNTGLILPLRSYAYIGSFPAIYYYPMFLLWESPLSARFLGIIFLLIQSILLSKIFNIKYYYIFIGLVAFFPYFFQHIVDTGPVGFHITSVFLIYYLTINWFKKLKITYPILIAIVIFLGIWTKLSYFWLIPGLGILFLNHIFENKNEIMRKENIKKILIHSLISFILLGVLLSMIFFSTSPYNSNNKPYLSQILNIQTYPLSKIIDPEWIKDKRVFKALINPFEATQRIYSVKQPSLFIYIYDIFIYLSLPLSWIIFSILYFRTNNNSKKQIIKSMVFFLCFIIVFFMILRTERSGPMHHTVLSFPFLILSFMSMVVLIRKLKWHKFIKVLFIIFILSNIFFFVSFSKQTIRSHDDPSKINLNKVLNDENLSKNYFYVVIDWGMYYYQGLYGNKFQSVLYMEPLSAKRQIARLKKLSKEHNRKMLFIYNSKKHVSDLALIENSFNLKLCNKISQDSTWKIILEEDQTNKNICFQ